MHARGFGQLLQTIYIPLCPVGPLERSGENDLSIVKSDLLALLDYCNECVYVVRNDRCGLGMTYRNGRWL